MKNHRLWLKFQSSWLLAAIIAIISTPVVAQRANFGTLELSPGFTAEQGITTGYTGGSYSLSAISNRDKDKKVCIGFGDPNPDHILVLEEEFDKLTISIDSGGQDTTVFIKSFDDAAVRCGDDTGSSKDGSVSDRHWKKGMYQLWVGTFNPGVKAKYTLKIQEK
jgi:hypothetical protein